MVLRLSLESYLVFGEYGQPGRGRFIFETVESSEAMDTALHPERLRTKQERAPTSTFAKSAPVKRTPNVAEKREDLFPGEKSTYPHTARPSCRNGTVHELFLPGKRVLLSGLIPKTCDSRRIGRR